MEDQSIITLLIVGIVLSKAIIAVLIYFLIIKNRALKLEKEKLLSTNAKLEIQNDEIIIYNKELKSSEDFKIKVLSIASHDLRAPITSMEMLLNLDDISFLSPQEMQEIFADLTSQLAISRTMIDEILLWTESQLRHNIENREVFSITEQIQSIVPLFNTEIQAKEIKLSNEVQITQKIYMCKDIFSFVIRNILSNAVKFCANQGTILIGFSAVENNKVKLFIQNDGEELSPEDLDNLNTKSSWTYKKTVNNHGAGLGISLCKDLFKRIGGSIKFENENGVGLKVSMVFPSVLKNNISENGDITARSNVSHLKKQTIDY